MAYRKVDMWEILNVLRRLGRGESQAAVARHTEHCRKTIRRYLAAAAELGWRPGDDEPTEELAATIYRRLRPSLDGRAGEVEQRLLPHREQIQEWLKAPPGKKRGLRLTKVHTLLRRRQGVDVPYSSLYRFAIKHCGFRERGRFTVRMAECGPGELAEVDFGKLGLIPHPETDRRRTAWALIVVLPNSRHQYVHVTHSQKLPDLISGLEDAWIFFGGVSRRLVLDNLKAAVTKADLYDPIFARTFEDYAHYRGFIIDAAASRHPTGKPVVERNVPYVRENLFRGENWRHLEHLQDEATRWCLETAGTRIHGTTRQRPLDVFEQIERDQLLPLIRERYDPPSWGQCKVHPDHHISFGKALYSVPTRFIGQSVWVEANSKIVRVYSGGERIKTHARQAPGGRATDYDDYPSELTSYALRDPARLIRQAEEHGPNTARFMTELLAGVFPWAKLRQGQKLLRLGQKYGSARIDLACQRALAFEVLNVRRVESILRQDLEQISLPFLVPTDCDVATIPPARFAREPASFTHNPTGD